MLIRIMYRDGRQDRVKRAQLKGLIEHCQIKMFKRFSGWVSVLYWATSWQASPSDPSPWD